ncbi:MAG TPA: GNAT family N-acetyltransferase [Candidatus Acidoferrum sp.]|nr:GNAT family N-acetyltransferase [Candidatus Acidoferrum sp.]
MSAIAIQEFTSFEGLNNLRPEWNQLVQSEGYGPAQSFDWLSTLWEVNRANRELLVLVARDDEGLAGIVPLVQEKEQRKGITARVLKMLSGFHALHGTPFLLGRRKRETLSAMFDYLRRRNGSWTLWFSAYQIGDPQEDLFFSILEERGYRFSTAAGVRSPYQRLEETWGEKLKTLQPRFRTALRSREKRLREKGKVELHFCDGPGQWQEGLEAICEIEKDSWKADAGTAITSQDFQWQFYSHYAPVAAEAGILRLPILYLEGEPIAYDYALLEDGVYYLLKTSYKNMWHDCYPGFVLRKLLVEWMYSGGGREIDYLGKDEDWKMKWTSYVREHRDCYVYGQSLTARYLSGLQKVGSLFKRKV